MASVLVTGGAGYVGSAAVARLRDSGHAVTVLDDLSTGHREHVLTTDFVQGKVGDASLVRDILTTRKIDCVMHFAAKSLVEESFRKRELYYENNVLQTRRLIETMLSCGVRRLIFSSTCAIFGNPGDREITEDLPKSPINPYGETKLEMEQFMKGWGRAKGLDAIALRYFNAAGSEPRARVGESHEPETHLIPRALRAAARGEVAEVFGNDYPTRDGTCIRDYVHIWDLAQAHVAAMERLLTRAPNESGEGHFEGINLGSENGFTVLEVLGAIERVLKRPVQKKILPRRPGDPPKLVANSIKARKALGFLPEFTHIDSIVESAWHWELRKQGALKKIAFLDRDGTINLDPGYISKPSQLELIPGVGPALKRLKDAGFLLVVVSNQSGVGRGWIRLEDMPLIHGRLQDLLVPHGVAIDHFEICTHRPDEDCSCRKPKPKLLWDAARRLGAEVEASVMVGDKISDLHAGKAAGCKASYLVRTGHGRETELGLDDPRSILIGDDLNAVVGMILA